MAIEGEIIITAKVTKNTKKEDAAIKRLKSEVSRKASMANKRLNRLEKNDLTSTPAYQQYVKGGSHKFSVRGKSYNELEAELSRVDHFINAKTSTVRGAHSVLKSLASTTGISYKRVGDLNAKASQFFELASKANQYLDNLSGVASAIGYQKIWTQINNYVADNKIDLGDSTNNLDGMISAISGMLEAQQVKDVTDKLYTNIIKSLK